MSTTEEKPNTRIERHVLVGAGCGVLALVLLVLAVGYFSLASYGYLPEPPLGLGPLWAMAIAILAFVPIAQSAAACAARPARQDIAALRAEHRQDMSAIRCEIRQALEQFGDRALQSALETGHLQGVVSELRSNPPSQEASAAVISLVERSRNGSEGR